MSLRVTPQTQRSQTLHRVQQTTQHLNELNAELSSGRRLRVASDHPTDLGVVLANRVEMSRLNVNLENIRSASSTVEFSVQMLTEANGILDSVSETIAEAATGTDVSSTAITTRLEQLLERFLEIANTKQAGRYLFGGSATGTVPYEIAATDAQGLTARIGYRGNNQQSAVIVGAGREIATHIPGNQIFGPRVRQIGETSFFGNTGVQSGTGTDSGMGRAELLVRHTATSYTIGSGIAAGLSSQSGDTILGAMGEHTLEIVDTSGTGIAGTVTLNGGNPVDFTSDDTDLKVEDGGGGIVYLDTTAIASGFNGEIELRGDGELSLDGGVTNTVIDFSATQTVTDPNTDILLHVDTTAVRQTGNEIVDFAATDDIFGTLLATRHDLNENTDLGNHARSELLNRRLANVEEIRLNLLQKIGELAGQAENLQAYEQHAEDMHLQIRSLTGELEDADAVSAIVGLQAQEHQFNLELALAARISTMSLLNFIR